MSSREKMLSQKSLADASVKLVKRILELSPQTSDGAVNYFICGSLITNVLPLVVKMEEYELDKDGKVIKSGDTIELTPESRRDLLEIVRHSKSLDIDVAVLRKDPYHCRATEKAPSSVNIKAGLEEEFDMMYPNKTNMGDMMDRLGLKGIDSFSVAVATLEDGSKIIMPSLRSLLKYKCREAVNLDDAQYTSKRKDFVKLYKILSKIIDTSEHKEDYEMISKELKEIDDSER